MNAEDTTYANVRAFVDALVGAGLQHACVSPGARSTPLTLVTAAHPRLRAWSHIDERSGSFFALGIAKATRRPVAVVCTSGTAAANFLPAVIEAKHAHVPLLVLTADRPAELRGCGAPQTMDQIKLYGAHVKWFAEVGDHAAGESYFRSLACQAMAVAADNPPGPVHLNFPFREPLMPSRDDQDGEQACVAARRTIAHPTVPILGDDALARIADDLAQVERGLIVCGPFDHQPATVAAIALLAARLDYPLLADPLSQLRTGRHDLRPVVDRYDALLREPAFSTHMAPELLLRFGPLPTSKALLQYAQRHRCRHIVVDPWGEWNDPARTATDIVRADAADFCTRLSERLPSVTRSPGWRGAWREANRRAGEAIDNLLGRTAELFEGKVFAELAALLPDEALLYVGNSMPVRDLESFWPAGERRLRFLGNRGVNGIDGFVSSGLGAAAAREEPVVLVTGDLGFYHDLNGLLAAKRHDLRATIIVLNNDGGGIFSFLPQAEAGSAFDELFLTPHGLDFRGAVEMYGGAFTRVASWEQFRDVVRAAVGGDRMTVIEVPVERERNVQLHREVWDAVGRAVATEPGGR